MQYAKRSQRTQPQHAQNPIEMLCAHRRRKVGIRFAVGTPVWLLGHQRFAVNALKGPPDLSREGLSWQQQPVQCDSETFQWALTVTITRIGLSRSIAPQSGAAGMSPRVAFLKRSGRTLGPRGAPERRASPSVVITDFPKIICDRTSEVTESVRATLCALSGYNVIFSRWYSR
jgi:hypothetical protein